MAENKNETTEKQEVKKGKCGCGCKPPVKK